MNWRGWGGLVPLAVVGLGWTLLVVRRARVLRRLRSGELSGIGARPLVGVLYEEYGEGRLYPRVLEAAKVLPAPTGPLGVHVLNRLVCIEVAAGRYREALEWRGRWRTLAGTGDFERLVRINEAEAVACLGQLEASLALTDFTDARSPFVRTGRALHRAWVLAELGRLDEGRAALRAEDVALAQLPSAFSAEWHFARFALEFAARDWKAAAAALVDAGRVVERESSRRNLAFLSGRLAFAQEDFTLALAHFERGAASVYRAQGGAALLEWGEALARLGRPAEARAAWQRCLAEDAQSPCAAGAAARLGADQA